MKTGATASNGASPAIVRQTDSYVIIVPNEKGGVAKTMITLSLAAHTVAAHGRAQVADIDPQANAHDLTQVMTDPGYDVLHELDPMELRQIRRVRDYDVVLVDCPGSLKGNVVLDEALAHSDYAVIPYDHQPESVMPTIRTVARVKAAGVPYAVVLTKADPRLGADHITDAWETLEAAGIRHFRSVIRMYRAWPNSLRAGLPITRHNERYAPRLREDIGSLHTELLLDLGRRALRSA
jgi:chromosome partitioning protein